MQEETEWASSSLSGSVQTWGGEGETERVVRVGGNMTNHDNELPAAITNRKQIDIIIHIQHE